MKKIVCLVDALYEDLELWVPYMSLQEEGYSLTFAGPKKGETYSGKHGYPCKADIAFEQVERKSFDAVVIPGGFAPDKLRRSREVLELVKEFDVQNKLIAFICHAGWVPISARVLKGRRATSTSAIKDDMENAGAIWIDEAVVADRNMISSRTVADLPVFCRALKEWLRRSP